MVALSEDTRMSQVRSDPGVAQPPAGRQFRRRLRGGLSDELPAVPRRAGGLSRRSRSCCTPPGRCWNGWSSSIPNTSPGSRRWSSPGRVEILGGGFFEPILTMIPHRDRVGQIRGFSRLSRGDCSAPGSAGCGSPSGSGSSSSSRRSPRPGIEYTVLDDFHFHRAGCPEDDVFGYYLTEDDGRLLKVFPGSETLRYMHPVPRAARDLRIPATSWPSAGPARPSSSPTTARSSAPGPRRSIMFTRTAG